MKKLTLSGNLILIVLLFSACGTIDRVVRRTDEIDRKTDRYAQTSERVTGDTGPLVASGIDFKEGEVLCGGSQSTMKANSYHIAKVLRPATEQTKSQAEVLFIDGGKKKWTSFVIPSHKARANELRVGKDVLFYTYGTGNPTDRKQYRFQRWVFGTITADDEAYKDIYEIKGRKIHIGWIRIPDLHGDSLRTNP